MVTGSDGVKTPRGCISFGGIPGIPGVRIITANESPHLWTVFHEAYDICTITQTAKPFGHSEWVYRRREYCGRVGNVFIAEPGETHVMTRADGPGSYWVLCVDPALMDQTARQMGLSRTVHIGRPHTDLLPVFRSFVRFHSSAEQDNNTLLEMESNLVECLGQLLINSAEEPVWALRERHDKTAVSRARDLICDCFASNLSLQQLAETCGVSPFHLARQFREQYGLPPHRYLVSIRVCRAADLLARGYPIAWVASEVGFADQSHFTRHFRRQYGVTPRRFLSGLQKNRSPVKSKIVL